MAKESILFTQLCHHLPPGLPRGSPLLLSTHGLRGIQLQGARVLPRGRPTGKPRADPRPRSVGFPEVSHTRRIHQSWGGNSGAGIATLAEQSFPSHDT